jgi:hypothetical protein
VARIRCQVVRAGTASGLPATVGSRLVAGFGRPMVPTRAAPRLCALGGRRRRIGCGGNGGTDNPGDCRHGGIERKPQRGVARRSVRTLRVTTVLPRQAHVAGEERRGRRVRRDRRVHSGRRGTGNRRRRPVADACARFSEHPNVDALGRCRPWHRDPITVPRTSVGVPGRCGDSHLDRRNTRIDLWALLVVTTSRAPHPDGHDPRPCRAPPTRPSRRDAATDVDQCADWSGFRLGDDPTS